MTPTIMSVQRRPLDTETVTAISVSAHLLNAGSLSSRSASLSYSCVPLCQHLLDDRQRLVPRDVSCSFVPQRVWWLIQTLRLCYPLSLAHMRPSL